MVTKNYKIVSAYMEAATIDGGTLSVSGVKAMDGNDISALTKSGSSTSNNRTLKNELSLVIGTGSASPTADDYMLEHNVTNSMADLSTLSTYSVDANGNLTVEVTLTGINNTGADVAVSEFGFVRNVYFASSLSSGLVTLFTRDVLNTPIILEAGKSFSLRATWTES